MQVVSAAEIDRALAFPALIDALADAFRGALAAPPRQHYSVGGGDAPATLLVMPAWTDSTEAEPFTGVKVASVVPGNSGKGLPSVIGSYLLLDGDTGAPLAVLDAARLTLWRTAATSALAARHLARADCGRMAMVGAGALAPFLIRAHASQRPIAHVALWKRHPERAQALAASLAAAGLPVETVRDLEAAVRGADLVSCATLSTAPLIEGDWLPPGVHLDLVGAFTGTMREADDAALQRASVFVDTPAALTEGGEVALALAAGSIREQHVRGDLADLCTGRAPGRTSPGEITLFKSIGASIEDLAAAMMVWRRLAVPS